MTIRIDTTRRHRGTWGFVGFLFLSLCALSSTAAADIDLPDRIPDWRAQADLFATVAKAKPEDRETVIAWIDRHQSDLGPAFLFHRSNLTIDSDPDAALEWYIVAYMRGSYDAARCADPTAGQGLIAAMRKIAGNVTQLIAKDKAPMAVAGLRALKRDDLFHSTTSPMWVCVHAISSVYGGESDGVVDRDKWPAIEQEIRERNESAFKRVLGR